MAIDPDRNIAFKYTSASSARLIIENCTLRVGRPTEINDPFDTYIEDLFEAETKDMYDQAAATLVDVLACDPVTFAQRIGVPIDIAMAESARINRGSESDCQALLAAARELATTNPDLEADRKALESERPSIVAQFRNTGIFCATRRNDNLLMWSHYADGHKGVVLGFAPDVKRDSFLRLLEPVTYSDVRPSFYGPFDPLTGNLGEPTPEVMHNFTRSLTMVKSKDWEYEQELRVVIPSYVPEGESAVFLPFYPHELAELYLGMCMGDSDRQEIVSAARSLNKSVRVFRVRMKPGAYALAFEPFT